MCAVKCPTVARRLFGVYLTRCRRFRSNFRCFCVNTWTECIVVMSTSSVGQWLMLVGLLLILSFVAYICKCALDRSCQQYSRKVGFKTPNMLRVSWSIRTGAIKQVGAHSPANFWRRRHEWHKSNLQGTFKKFVTPTYYSHLLVYQLLD